MAEGRMNKYLSAVKDNSGTGVRLNKFFWHVLADKFLGREWKEFLEFILQQIDPSDIFFETSLVLTANLCTNP